LRCESLDSADDISARFPSRGRGPPCSGLTPSWLSRSSFPFKSSLHAGDVLFLCLAMRFQAQTPGPGHVPPLFFPCGLSRSARWSVLSAMLALYDPTLAKSIRSRVSRFFPHLDRRAFSFSAGQMKTSSSPSDDMVTVWGRGFAIDPRHQRILGSPPPSSTVRFSRLPQVTNWFD